MPLYAEFSGDLATQAPLVLIHGFGGNASVWDAVKAHLPDDIPVIAYDLPGHRNSLDAEGRGGAGKMAKALLADLSERGYSAFHLAGHSMGGAIAALIAMRAGAAVKSVTLIAPGGMGPEINADALEHFAKAKTAEELRAAMRVMVAPDFDIPGQAVNALAADRAIAGATEALCEIYDAMFTEQTSTVRAQGTLPMELLETLTCPVSVMWGEDDAILPFHQMDRLPEAFVKTHFPGAGHMLLDERPEQVAGALVMSVGMGGDA